jgi:hypothetical protein
MALYELNNRQVEWLKTLIKKVAPAGMEREAAKQFIAEGDEVLMQLLRPINPVGKPKEIIK